MLLRRSVVLVQDSFLPFCGIEVLTRCNGEKKIKDQISSPSRRPATDLWEKSISFGMSETRFFDVGMRFWSSQGK